MAKIIFTYAIFLSALYLTSCSSDIAKLPSGQDGNVALRMATRGIYNFEDNIHDLTIYAFRQAQESDAFLFYKTLAELDQEAIGKLQDDAAGSAKLFSTSLPAGLYRLFFVANAAGNYTGTPEMGVTRPPDIFLTYPVGGLDTAYFLSTDSVLVGESTARLDVVLNRAVSKLLVTLYGVPEPIDTIWLKVGNIAARIGIDGSLSTGTVEIEKKIPVYSKSIYQTDTVVYQLLTFPTSGAVSGFEIGFRSKSGEERVKLMPGLVLLPDKYIQVTGRISRRPGGLLNFNLTTRIFVADSWEDKTIPDFILDRP